MTSNPSTNPSIEGIQDDIDFLKAMFQSLDDERDAGSDASKKRNELLQSIKELEKELEARRREQRDLSRHSSSSYAFPFDSGSSMPHSGFGGSPSIPQWGSSAVPLTSRPIQPNNGLFSPQSYSSRKRDAGDADLPAPEPSRRRMASFTPPPRSSASGSSRRESYDSDGFVDDELWKVLGLDGRDSFREFQDEQKKAEQWLEDRKEEQRRDAECARRLQDNLLASPRPNSAQSCSTRYSGSNVFNGIGSPALDLEPGGANRVAGFPPVNSLQSRPDGFSRPSFASSANTTLCPPPVPAQSPSLADSDDSDLAEVTPADFNRSHPHHPYPSTVFNRSMGPAPKDLSTSNTYRSGPFGLEIDPFPSPYLPWGLPPGPGPVSKTNGSLGPGPLYGPNVLQSTMARLNAARDPSNSYPGPPPGGGLWSSGSGFPDLMDYELRHSLNDYLSDPYAGDSTQTREEIKQLLETIRPDADISKENREGTPDALVYPLLEHQKLGLSWMRTMEDSDKKGGILADDMGLGKTIQALALMATHRPTDREQWPTLIVAPVSLMQQWKREVQRMLKPGRHQMSVYVLHGDRGKRGMNFTDLKRYDVVLTTYGTLASEFKRKEKYEQDEREGKNAVDFTTIKNNLPVLGPISKWHRVILDEAQCIKNRNTKSAQASCRLNATYRWCMSGTPMMNNVEELHSLLRFLRIRPYNSLEKFNTEFTRPLKNPNTSAHERAMEKLQVLLKAVLLRRTKTSTIDGRPILQLPARVSEEVHAVFNEDEQEFYDSLETRTQNQFNRYLDAGSVGRHYSSILVLLLRLRQACCHPHLIKDFSVDVNANTNDLDLVANAKTFGPQVVARVKDSDDLECPICMDAVENPIIFFPCGHGACGECFSRISDPSLSVRQGIEGGLVVKCPNCRGQIDPKKITDHATFKNVHFPDLNDEPPVEPKPADDAEDSDDDESNEETLNGFIVKDEGDGSSKAKGKGKMPRKPKKTLAQLKKEGSKNQKAKRKYLRRLEKTFVSSAKIDKTMEILQRVQNETDGEKTIIFSQFTSLLDLLEIPIDRKNWGYRRYDGSMRPADRNSSVMDFTDNPNCKIMLVSLKAGNSGLNLVAASQVIVFDPFWNPYVEDQAVDRAHRIGQMRDVHIHRILVQKTVEDRILELQAKKRDLVEGALDEKAGKNLSRLGTRELGYLFGVNN